MSNYPHEREILLQWLSEAPGAPIVLTGDRHSGEINAIEINGKKIVEACASPITANAHPHHDEENTTRVHEGTTDTQHFGTLRLNSEKGQWNISVSLIDSEGVALFQYNYEV
jgi:phosphodiesterase/alkaline phosphatase D-like protein